MALRPGLYDQPLTEGLRRELDAMAKELVQADPLDAGESARALARVLQERLIRVLDAQRADDRVDAQLTLVNALLVRIASEAPGVVEEEDHLARPGRVLRAVLEAPTPPAVPVVPPRPALPLSVSGLLVNGRHDLSVGPEIKKEIASADRVDLLCSFLKWSGFRLVQEELEQLCRRGELRVLTTAYMGATERRALDELIRMGAKLKVSYDTTRTRLHAKAWLFHRATGFSTGVIGSSNLSHAAMLDGVEWNVRISHVDNAGILEKFHATFEQYWQDPVFQAYDPDEFSGVVANQARERLAPYLRLDVAPRPHQQEILDALEAERSRGHLRNLVVAATGTGKTIAAALDYKRLRDSLPRARLLFVAHRREILSQSLATFRTVCRDGSFGELLVGGDSPVRFENVFASIQALHESRLMELAPDHFDVVIVDEFHHAAAPTYERLLRHLTPKVLLGLTATPERADGHSILGWFEGRVASELRLWKALDQDLLAPFHYFGVGNAPDLREGVRWSAGRYHTQDVSRLYTSDHLFAKRILQETVAKVGDVSRMRALGFCVDIAHAEFMAERFNEAGIAAAAVSTRSRPGDREAALRALGTELNIIFSVDLFNEGVDLPEVDTLLFLRPTESATVFLQQLGRGLRQSAQKECCTVLDFIGGAHRRFRFDQRFRALLGGTRREIETQIEAGFPRLPSGCVIQLDPQAQEAVLENIRQAVGRERKPLVDDLVALGDVDLSTFLQSSGYDLEDVYSARAGWSDLRRAAGFERRQPDGDDSLVERAFGRMLHVDDFDRLDRFAALTRNAFEGADARDPLARMLFVLLGHHLPFADMDRLWAQLERNDWLRRELSELLLVLADRCRRVSQPSGSSLLRDHATYSRSEIMAAFDERTKRGGAKKTQTGVYYIEAERTDLFFVTLEKSEKGFTATTMYRDYPMTSTLFHWETQSTCHAATKLGARYTQVGLGQQRALLFVRERQRDDRGHAMPYRNLGSVRYRRHEGARPMRIEWELLRPMPPDFYQQAKLAAG